MFVVVFLTIPLNSLQMSYISSFKILFMLSIGYEERPFPLTNRRLVELCHDNLVSTQRYPTWEFHFGSNVRLVVAQLFVRVRIYEKFVPSALHHQWPNYMQCLKYQTQRILSFLTLLPNKILRHLRPNAKQVYQMWKNKKCFIRIY